MAWLRIKNSRSSAQPGTHPHDGVQATVAPAPDAEPPLGTRNTGVQNTGIDGTRHSVVSSSSTTGPSATGPSTTGPPFTADRQPRPIRYAHGAAEETTVPAEPAEPPMSLKTSGEPPPPAPVTYDPVLTGTVLPGPPYEETAGLVFEAARQPTDETPEAQAPDEHADEPANEGLGIFGDVTTTEVPDDEPGPGRQDHEATRVIPIGASWNQQSRPAAPDDEPQEARPSPFDRIRAIRWGGVAEEQEPRVSTRDLPPDVQMHLWRLRLIIMAVVGVLFAFLTRSWEIALTLAILAGIIDTIYRSRNAGSYVNGRHAGARQATSKQLGRLRRVGYFVLNDRPIPNSPEFIDHLVVGPTGVYAIDSEKWDPKLPIRTLNGKRLYVGPESQKERLNHAKWEAGQAAELLSAALGTEIAVRPALAIYGPKVPWDIATIRDVDVFTGSALRKYLKARSRMRGKRKDGVPSLTREEIHTICETAQRVMPDSATSATSTPYTPVG